MQPKFCPNTGCYWPKDDTATAGVFNIEPTTVFLVPAATIHDHREYYVNIGKEYRNVSFAVRSNVFLNTLVCEHHYQECVDYLAEMFQEEVRTQEYLGREKRI